VNCNDPSIKYICSVRKPSCPKGYTWLYQLGQSCFKAVGPLNKTVGSYTFMDSTIARAFCAQDGTRLAVAETKSESDALAGWLKMTNNPVRVATKFVSLNLLTSLMRWLEESR